MKKKQFVCLALAAVMVCSMPGCAGELKTGGVVCGTGNE